MTSEPRAPKRRKPKRLGVREINIEQADNGGYMTHTRYRTEEGPDLEYDSGDRNVHATHDDMVSYINNLFKGDASEAKTRRIKAAQSMMSSPMNDGE